MVRYGLTIGRGAGSDTSAGGHFGGLTALSLLLASLLELSHRLRSSLGRRGTTHRRSSRSSSCDCWRATRGCGSPGSSSGTRLSLRCAR
jgi:hypothetical protein